MKENGAKNMQYQSSNILTDFEFHDAHFSFKSFENSQLIVTAHYLNIHKSTEQNPHLIDKEITSAKITFDKFQVISYEPGRTWKRNKNGELHTDEPQVVFEGAVAHNKFLAELHAGTTVFAFGQDGNYYLEGCGDEPWFLAYFTFNSAIVEWDEYRKPAWYEEKPFKK